MHLHRHDCEIFLVLEGALQIVVDGQEHETGAGSAAVLPAGLRHGFVVTSETARYLTMHQGPTFEQFVAAAADQGISTPPQLTEIAAAHGIDIVGPRLAPERERTLRGLRREPDRRPAYGAGVRGIRTR